jgi:activator of HSP90 ATPase
MEAKDLFSPSEYLKSEDIEEAGGELELTIASVSSIEFDENGQKRKKGQLCFVDTNKKLTLNSTNTKALAAMYGEHNIDKEWVGKPAILYVDYHVEFQGKETKGIRIRLVDKKMDAVTAFWTRAKELGWEKKDALRLLKDNGENFEAAIMLLDADDNAPF